MDSGERTAQSSKDVRRYVPVVSTPFTFGIAAGDFNSDDRPDLIVSNNKNHDSVTSLLSTTPKHDLGSPPPKRAALLFRRAALFITNGALLAH